MNVSVQYGKVHALEGINLALGQGEVVGVIGPSGAGKSTLVGLLNGSLASTTGSVRILGSEWATTSARDRRRLRSRIGTVYQDYRLVDGLRVIHNVNAGHLGRWSTSRALASLWRPQGGLGTRDALRRVGIEELLHARTDRLSGGQRQRVAIARMLVQRPALMLADEPIASLDPVRGADIVRLLVDVAKEQAAALLLCLHAPELALEVCDRIVGLRAGRVQFCVNAADTTGPQLEALYRIEHAVSA